MPPSEKVTSAEQEVLEVLWDQAPLAASAVVAALSGRRDWSATTVKTLLSRLVDKGILRTIPDGRRYLYTPVISRGEFTRSLTRSFADRLFGGRAAPLVAHLAEGNGLTPDDIAELEALLTALKNHD